MLCGMEQFWKVLIYVELKIHLGRFNNSDYLDRRCL
jgi:hypothetical protein